jgi:hypothetical protein
MRALALEMRRRPIPRPSPSSPAANGFASVAPIVPIALDALSFLDPFEMPPEERSDAVTTAIRSRRRPEACQSYNKAGYAASDGE